MMHWLQSCHAPAAPYCMWDVADMVLHQIGWALLCCVMRHGNPTRLDFY
jgi:hypothetical protein